jgi:ubiquitin-conjugating enzyme E2 M
MLLQFRNKPQRKRIQPGQVRIQKDITDLDEKVIVRTNFPDPNNLMHFCITIVPDSGYWKGHEYAFEFHIPEMYPHEPPKVKCLTKVYHPNIDTKGNILRSEWSPVLDINTIVYGLLLLFHEPNPNDPLNHEAAELLRKNVSKFKKRVCLP